MNQFDYRNTIVPDIHFHMLPDQELRGEITVSFSIGVAKDLTHDKRVRCDTLVTVHNLNTKDAAIELKSVSLFDIVSSEINMNTLFDDAKAYCIPISLQKADEMISQISKLLIGRELNLQLSMQMHTE